MINTLENCTTSAEKRYDTRCKRAPEGSIGNPTKQPRYTSRLGVWTNTNICTPLTPTNQLQVGQAYMGRDIKLSTSALQNNFKYFAHAYAEEPGNPSNHLRTTPDCNNLDQLQTGNYTVCEPSFGNNLQFRAENFCADSVIETGWDREDPSEDIDAVAIPQEILDQLVIKQNLVGDLAVLETQLNNPDIQADLVADINKLYEQINHTNSVLVALYLENNDRTAAENILEQENTVEAKMELVQMYVAEEDYLKAARVVNEIIALSKDDDLFLSTQKQQDYEDNKNYFADIEEILNNVNQSARKKSELSDLEKMDLQSIKDANLPVSIKAEVLLALNGDSITDHTIKYLTVAELNQNSNSTSFDYQLTATPNSASASTDIQYVLPADQATYSMQIIDNYQNIGNVEYTQTITNTTNQIVNVSNYTVGIYTVVIFKDNVDVANIQLLIIR